MLHDFPICVATDGTIMVALQWDYAAWTSGAASFTDDVQKLAAKSGQSTQCLWLSPEKFHHVCARNWKSVG